MKISELKNIIREEYSKIMSEISDYDMSLVPKDVQLNDDDIVEYLKNMDSITAIISDVSYKNNKKFQFEQEVKSIKSSLIDFILKYRFNDGEGIESLNTKTIPELEDHISSLTGDAKNEYDKIVYDFASNLVYDNLIDKESYYNTH